MASAKMGRRWHLPEVQACILAHAVLFLGLAAGRSFDVSTTVFGGTEQHRHSPLAVLQANLPGGDGTPPSSLKIFAEDPSWASKVTQFMTGTGADVRDIGNALNHVRHMSWAAGRTLKSKVVVLLALAEDARSDGNGRFSSTLIEAVSAASKHTSDAHFVLVSNGFGLGLLERAHIESELKGDGWRTLTIIEMTEFEGFSSAINRAMKTVPDNSVVAVLSTSAIFLPAGAADRSTSEDVTTKGVKGGVNGNYNGGAGSSDVFIAYERLKSNLSLAAAFEGEEMPWWSEEEDMRSFCSSDCSNHGRASSVGASHDEYGNIRLSSNISTHDSGLLVTAWPVHLDADRRDADDDAPTFWNERVNAKAGAFEEKKGDHLQHLRKDADTNEWACSTGGPPPPPPPSPSKKPPTVRLSQMAFMPLLVFDQETFFNLGKLDERFAFQGGIAEWISRAKMSDHSQIINQTSTSAGDRLCLACGQRRLESEKGAVKVVEGLRPPFSDSPVTHVHECGWSKRFIRSWSDKNVRGGSNIWPRGSTRKKGDPHEHYPHVSRMHNSGDRSELGENACQREGIGQGGSCRTKEAGDHGWDGKVVLDHKTRLRPDTLEALVQADADMFFLPLLLQQPASGHHFLAARRLSFNSKWMGRAPDELLVRSALTRRKQFPVAVVVVVLTDTSLLRAALEEVAVVVEHILVLVSNKCSKGRPKDNSVVLNRLNLLLEDVDSQTRGKLRVEVGSWSTETEQREYGNSVIREDSRNFSRVVVMDTGEFWHPVELAKALAIAHQHPESTSFRAGVQTSWTRDRLVDFPPDRPHDVWLVDPNRCAWDDYRNAICDDWPGDAHLATRTLARTVGVIHHLSHHEERHGSEQLQLRPVSGVLTVVDVGGRNDVAVPSWFTNATSHLPSGVDAFSAEDVWTKLSGAAASRHVCANPPCREGKEIHADWIDLGQEMCRVQGAVVVRRPNLASNIAPANTLEFVKTFQAYCGIFKSSLFPTREIFVALAVIYQTYLPEEYSEGSCEPLALIPMVIDAHLLVEVEKIKRFVGAIASGDSAAARYLSTYYTDVEVPKRAIDGYENTPTLVGMANVFVNELGYVWNEKNYIVPKSCWTYKFGPRASTSLPTNAKNYEKVFVMTQHWGSEYFHFMVEALPRITVALDFLREHLSIKVAIRAPPPDRTSHTQYIWELLELLGIHKERLIFMQDEIHAGLAILPSSVPCGKPDTQSINLLRRALLQAIYPSTGGVPPPVPRPVVVLIVRDSKRGLANNDEIREALKQELPSHDIVEFWGAGPAIAQLQIFATASLIVAPHGAGLSNMMVSALHTPILEIGPPDCSTCFLHLAVKLQHIYGRHAASSSWRIPCESWYEPNVDEVIVLVRDLFEAKRLADDADPPNIVDFRL